jgi:hypothetical protein
MRSKILFVLIASLLIGVPSAGMAGGHGSGGGGGGGKGGHFGHHFPHFRNHFLRDRAFLRNQASSGWGWGLGGGWGWPYGEGNSTTVVTFPTAIPLRGDVTGSIASPPCRLTAETFTVPASAGGTAPVQIVGCR